MHAARRRLLPVAVQGLLQQLGSTGGGGEQEWELGLLRAREQWCLNELASRLAQAKSEGTSLFDAWMLEESDLVQAVAIAYGERVVLEQFAENIKNVDPS